MESYLAWPVFKLEFSHPLAVILGKSPTFSLSFPSLTKNNNFFFKRDIISPNLQFVENGTGP